MRIWELNKSTPLAEYEVAVTSNEDKSSDTCQKDFSLSLNIAGGKKIAFSQLLSQYDHPMFPISSQTRENEP